MLQKTGRKVFLLRLQFIVVQNFRKISINTNQVIQLKLNGKCIRLNTLFPLNLLWFHCSALVLSSLVFYIWLHVTIS